VAETRARATLTGSVYASLFLQGIDGFLLTSPDGGTHRAEVRARGVAVAIDDFSTCYSSPARLGDLPVDVTEIDRSFVHDVGTARGEAPLSSIVTLAHALDADVIAEGVETLEQLHSLSALGVDSASGYLPARPAVPEHLPMALPVAASSRPCLQMHPSVAPVPEELRVR
jgi:EAL domain-containing protein (putative c-di-GMP-specific phosphodiesterase class I)